MQLTFNSIVLILSILMLISPSFCLRIRDYTKDKNLEAKWVDYNISRVFVKAKDETQWVEIQNSKNIFSKFYFLRFDHEWNVILWDPERKFYVKLTDTELIWDTDHLNMQNVLGQGKWEIPPPQTLNSPKIVSYWIDDDGDRTFVQMLHTDVWAEYAKSKMTYEFKFVKYGDKNTHVTLFDPSRDMYIFIKDKELFWRFSKQNLKPLSTGHWSILPDSTVL